MAALFDLSILAGTVAALLLLGLGAITVGSDSRPGFGEDEPRFPEHHNITGGTF